MVGSILCFSVVASMNIACDGGSSRVFRKALKALCESIWTSSMIYTLYFPTGGGTWTWSIRALMSSTELLDAASSSWIQYERPSRKETQDSHSPQGVISSPGFEQLIIFAKIRAVVVFPTPLGPQNRYAWASCPRFMEFDRVLAITSCPIRVPKDSGLYFLADTIYSLIDCKYNKIKEEASHPASSFIRLKDES